MEMFLLRQGICRNIKIVTSAAEQFAEKRHEAFVAAVPRGGTAIGDRRTTNGALKCAAPTARSKALA
jgi:hypothetical protein